MIRRDFLRLTAALALATCWGGSLQAAIELISEATAARHGFVRPWFTQVEFDRARGRLLNLRLDDGTLFAQSNTGAVQAIDAETGKTLWRTQVGKPYSPAQHLDAHGDFVALVRGSNVYVLNRHNGDLLYECEVEGSPGAGPCLSSRRVYVPMTGGLVAAYPLEPMAKPTAKNPGDLVEEPRVVSEAERRRNLLLAPPTTPPLMCQSTGLIAVQPLLARENSIIEVVVWPTDLGYLNVAEVNRVAANSLSPKYRKEIGSPILAQPAYLPPHVKSPNEAGTIITAASNGNVQAFNEKDGKPLWQFSTAESIFQPPAALADRVYIVMRFAGMYCLDAKTGKEVWRAPGMVQFVAASKGRVYAVDRLGRLTALDARSGKLLDTMAVEGATIKLQNAQSDRIFLADEKGFIQCLHEAEQTSPLVHNADRSATAEGEAKPAERAVPKKPAAKEAGDGEA